MMFIDGHKFAEMVKMGAYHLKQNADYVDSLNVFPVPDGDTGTNMNLSMTSGAKETEEHVHEIYPEIKKILPDSITFMTSQELLDMYPNLSPKEREDKIVRDKGAVFLMEIGKVLADGKKHDGRSPDYDDWELNGDILFYNPVLDNAIELSSMGIRVDEKSLDYQLEALGCNDRRELDYHKALLNGELPQTIGGGIGQSRICMYFLRKAHIGEVQASVWDEKNYKICSENGIELL